MQDKKQRLQDLFDSRNYSTSSIVYCDGIKKISVCFNELGEHVCFIEDFLKHLRLRGTVCILTEQGLALPAIILGILKVDSTFAFLDVHKPFESLSAYQKYEQIKTLIVQERYLKDLESQLCRCWKKTDEFYVFSKYNLLQSSYCRNDTCNTKEYEACKRQSEIAYIIQTSGTTGEPKIVKVPHRCIVPNIIDFRCRFSVTANDVILQSTRITFDPSIIEIFLSLSTGATLIMIADHIRSIPKKLLEVVVDNKITVLQGTPSLICSFGKKALKENLLSKESVLRVLALGGEVCPSFSKLQLWKCDGNCTEIYNLYGLTEVSCWASCFRIDFQNGKSLPSISIGEPLLNTKLEIRDEKGEIADEGELYIGGSGRFCIVNNEQWPMNSDSVLRPTGDFAYKTSNGFIYFEGRSDSVIKYKGHKISLQLINSIVDSFSEVENSFIHFDPSSAKLCIFIVLVCAGSLDSDVERKMVKRLRKSLFSLPPTIFSPVPFIPMTKHGKADKEKLLSLLDVNNEQRASFRSTMSDDSEDVIANIWKSYTNNQVSVGEKDNFVLHGGDSLTAIQFVSDIEWHFQLSFPLLIEKILNETFKDVTQYANLCLKGHSQCTTPLSENDSPVVKSVEQPPPKKMCFDVKCFKFACKGGYLEYCCCSNNSANCLHKKSDAAKGDTLHLSLVSKWDLKKCVDATSCILYVPQFNQHLIFIGSHFGVFSCINVEERLEKWQIAVPDRIESSACISSCGNYVLFGCYDHHLYCINIADGRVSWKYETGAEVKSSPSVSVNNKVFVGSHDKCVYAIDVKSGQLLWKKQIAYGSIFSSPLTIDKQSTVCVGTLDGVLTLLNMELGDILWKYCSGKPLFSSPVIISDYIFVGSTDKCILCLDFEGKEIFKYLTDGPVFSSAAFSNSSEENLVLFGCHDFYVYCLTLNGDLLWKTLCDSAIYATPVIFTLNNCFYVCVTSSKGTIYIFELGNGKVVLSWNCPGEIFSSPVVLDNVLVVGCRDNNVYCFRLEV